MRSGVAVCLLVGLGIGSVGAGLIPQTSTARVSTDSAGVEGNASSHDAEVNNDGVFVVFESLAPLDPADSNGLQDIYLKNMLTGEITWVSKGFGGGSSNGDSHDPAISYDALLVTYSSDASNLVRNDSNGVRDVFLYHTRRNRTMLVSEGLGGTPANGSSNHPKVSAYPYVVVVFDSLADNLVSGDLNGTSDIYARDIASGAMSLISRTPLNEAGNGPSTYPDIPARPERIAYESRATNLVPDANGSISDVFVYIPNQERTVLASVATDGTQGNADSGRPDLSALDIGRRLTFHSDATNLVASDSNNERDVFWRNLPGKTTRLVSVNSSGAQGNGASQNPSIDSEGEWVAYESMASNLVPNDTNGAQDAFVWYAHDPLVERVSVSSGGGQADGPSFNVAAAANGPNPFIVFESLAFNLVPDDTNAVSDVFEYRP